MQGIKRRVVYITLYEAIAIAVTSVGLLMVSDSGLAHAGALAVATSMIAVVWNLVFNWLFEKWEATRPVKGRSIGRRVLHAVGFEGGLLIFLVPLFAWWLDMSLLNALITDIGLLVFFLVYTFVFNWAFDAVFGLPASSAELAPLSP